MGLLAALPIVLLWATSALVRAEEIENKRLPRWLLKAPGPDLKRRGIRWSRRYISNEVLAGSILAVGLFAGGFIFFEQYL